MQLPSQSLGTCPQPCSHHIISPTVSGRHVGEAAMLTPGWIRPSRVQPSSHSQEDAGKSPFSFFTNYKFVHYRVHQNVFVTPKSTRVVLSWSLTDMYKEVKNWSCLAYAFPTGVGQNQCCLISAFILSTKSFSQSIYRIIFGIFVVSVGDFTV